MAGILSKTQISVLEVISKSALANSFYFSGGTALAYYYLQHRKSEDLDFFSENEFDPQSIYVLIKSMQNDLKYKQIDYQNSFNRNLFLLHFAGGEVLKLEFTYYPFKQVEAPTKRDGLFVDSLNDIATNKLFTISQQPRGRDYYDLFAIIQKAGYEIETLRMQAKGKFDWQVDSLQLASRFYEVSSYLDDPILARKMNREAVVNFFQQEALAYKNQILKK